MKIYDPITKMPGQSGKSSVASAMMQYSPLRKSALMNRKLSKRKLNTKQVEDIARAFATAVVGIQRPRFGRMRVAGSMPTGGAPAVVATTTPKKRKTRRASSGGTGIGAGSVGSTSSTPSTPSPTATPASPTFRTRTEIIPTGALDTLIGDKLMGGYARLKHAPAVAVRQLEYEGIPLPRFLRRLTGVDSVGGKKDVARRRQEDLDDISGQRTSLRSALAGELIATRKIRRENQERLKDYSAQEDIINASGFPERERRKKIAVINARKDQDAQRLLEMQDSAKKQRAEVDEFDRTTFVPIRDAAVEAKRQSLAAKSDLRAVEELRNQKVQEQIDRYNKNPLKYKIPAIVIPATIADYALDRYGILDPVGGGVTRRIVHGAVNSIFPPIQNEAPEEKKPSDTKKRMEKRSTMCKCGSGMSKSMCKCGSYKKSMRKSSIYKSAATDRLRDAFYGSVSNLYNEYAPVVSGAVNRAIKEAPGAASRAARSAYNTARSAVTSRAAKELYNQYVPEQVKSIVRTYEPTVRENLPKVIRGAKRMAQQYETDARRMFGASSYYGPRIASLLQEEYGKGTGPRSWKAVSFDVPTMPNVLTGEQPKVKSQRLEVMLPNEYEFGERLKSVGRRTQTGRYDESNAVERGLQLIRNIGEIISPSNNNRGYGIGITKEPGYAGTKQTRRAAEYDRKKQRESMTPAEVRAAYNRFAASRDARREDKVYGKDKQTTARYSDAPKGRVSNRDSDSITAFERRIAPTNERIAPKRRVSNRDSDSITAFERRTTKRMSKSISSMRSSGVKHMVGGYRMAKRATPTLATRNHRSGKFSI